MRGQAAVELLITIGIILAFTIPVVLLLLSVSQMGYEETTLAQADAAARTLAETINFVYSQGEGAKRVILLNTPPSTQEVIIRHGEVVVRIRTSKGIYEGTAPLFAEVKETELEQSGMFLATVESVRDRTGKVIVEVAGVG
ncbi:MAG: hypothetical protein QW590_02370 [Candidatus Bilamarchaeaceae archaeon]